jgi:hypothetical protein
MIARQKLQKCISGIKTLSKLDLKIQWQYRRYLTNIKYTGCAIVIFMFVILVFPIVAILENKMVMECYI